MSPTENELNRFQGWLSTHGDPSRSIGRMPAGSIQRKHFLAKISTPLSARDTKPRSRIVRTSIRLVVHPNRDYLNSLTSRVSCCVSPPFPVRRPWFVGSPQRRQLPRTPALACVCVGGICCSAKEASEVNPPCQPKCFNSSAHEDNEATLKLLVPLVSCM